MGYAEVGRGHLFVLSKGMPCTQCARSAKFWMSANTRTLVLAPFHKFLVPYQGFFRFLSIQDVAYLNCQPFLPIFNHLHLPT